MTDDPCERLDAYLDDELSPDERLAFEAHMASCDPCVDELPRRLALMSVLDDAAELAAATDAATKSGGPRLALVPGGSQTIPVTTGEPTGRVSDAPPAIRLPSRRRPRWIAAGLVGAIAAAAALVIVIIPPGPPAPPAVASLQDQLGPTRSIQARLSYRGADRYRPLDVARGARSSEPISIERMGQLEHAKDWHGVAVAALLAGERERAARFFAQAPSTPQVDSDRAALELIDGSQDALERGLDDVDRALKAEPNNPTALWNRALVLVGLNLPLAASREFDHVIALGEPG
jgi:tetratricopeptide (TPR) repeat protein